LSFHQSLGLFLLCLFLGSLAWIIYREADSPAQAEQISNQATVDWNGVIDNRSIFMTISWLPVPRFPGGEEDTFGARQLEKRFNIKIKPIFLDAQGYVNVKPLMFAGGDIPDVTWDGDPGDVQRDIFHGCILPVPWEVIKKYAPTYFRLITQYAPLGWVYTYHDGKNWGLPTIWTGGRLPAPGVWRKDWLDKVGIHKEPETLEEFHEAFRRFTFNDPAGDGKADTYGLTDTTVSRQMFTEFFGAFGALPFDWVEHDGNVTWGGIAPEARATLQMLAGWYREGIIDPDLVTDGMGGDRRMREKFMNGRVGYASGLGQFNEFDLNNPDALVNVMGQLNPAAKAVPAHLPVGPDGKRGTVSWGAAANTLVIGKDVAKEPAKLIRVLEMIELQVSENPDTYLLYNYGKRGKHWDYRIPDTGEIGTGPSSGIHVLPPYNDSKVFQRELLTIWGVENPEMTERFMPVSQKQFIEKYQNYPDCRQDAIGRPDVIPSAAKYLNDLMNLQLSVYTDIIRGEKPISAFDQFREEWLDRGGRKMTEEAALFLEQKNKLYRRLGAHD
jgi:putative aldouronate transport system substrate-binding protein